MVMTREEIGLLFIGDDWAEAHHDIEIEDDHGQVLVSRRLPEGLAGVTLLHELIAEHLDPSVEPDQVLIGIETDRGPWVQALLAAGYVIYAINRCRWLAIGSGTPPRGRSRIPRMPICWLRSSGWTGPITARSPATPRSPSTSKWRPGRIRR